VAVPDALVEPAPIVKLPRSVLELLARCGSVVALRVYAPVPCIQEDTKVIIHRNLFWPVN